MNPNQVKRREYLGLSGLLLGAILVLSGVISLLFLLPLGLGLLGLGCALFAAGVLVLMHIPDLVGPPEEVW